MRRTLVAATAVALATGSPGRGTAQDARPAGEAPPAGQAVVAVVGFAREVELESWRDVRVALGLRALLAEELYNSGRFRLLDEKEEIRAELRELAGRLWQAERGVAIDSLLQRLAGLRPDMVAHGRVVRFRSPTSPASLGPVHRNQRVYQVEVEVTLTETRSGRAYTATGRGETSRVASSALFSLRRDEVLFDETGVGVATRDALREACARLLAAYARAVGS